MPWGLPPFSPIYQPHSAELGRTGFPETISSLRLEDISTHLDSFGQVNPGAASPISSLPVETLQHIFALAARWKYEEVNYYTRKAIMRVSRHWRSAAISTSEVWSTISMRRGGGDDCRKIYRMEFERAARFADLHIILDPGWRVTRGSPAIVLETRHIFLQLALSLQHKWRKLTLGPPYRDVLAVLETGMDSTYLKNLRSIICTNISKSGVFIGSDIDDEFYYDDYGDKHDAVLQEAVNRWQLAPDDVVPSLEGIWLTMPHLGSLTCKDIPLVDMMFPPSLTSLTLEVNNIPALKILEVLTSMGGLKRLKLSLVDCAELLQRVGRLIQLHLPQLASLSLTSSSDNGLAAFISLLDCPNLSHLELLGEHPRYTYSWQLWDRALHIVDGKHWPIDTLHLGQWRCNVSTLTSLLQTLPDLRRLAIFSCVDALAFLDCRLSSLHPLCGSLQEVTIENFTDFMNKIGQSLERNMWNSLPALRRLHLPEVQRDDAQLLIERMQTKWAGPVKLYPQWPSWIM